MERLEGICRSCGRLITGTENRLILHLKAQHDVFTRMEMGSRRAMSDLLAANYERPDDAGNAGVREPLRPYPQEPEGSMTVDV